MTDEPEERTLQADVRAACLLQLHAAIELLHDSNYVAAVTLAGAAEGILPATDNPHYRQKLQDWQKTLPPNIGGASGLNDFINWAKHGNNDGGPPTATFSELEAMVVIQRAISKFVAIYESQTPQMKAFNDWTIQRLQPAKVKPEKKPKKLKARLPRGLADRGPAEIAATRHMVDAIRAVFERYGFEPVETPAIEYTDALGKFLPDQDRPNEGVFSFQDDDEQWLSLRYDLTAPLARYVAENYQNLALPYRSYRYGYVYRNEKPGPGRFRQFMQFDADTVGAPTMAADAEMCMLAADTMEALGIKRGDYVVKVNNRKLLDGVMNATDIPENKRLTTLRALDKYDRLGTDGVRALLGKERKDESGDITQGADLAQSQIDRLMMLFESVPQPNATHGNLPEWEQKDSAFVYREFNSDVVKIFSEPGPGRLPISNHQTIGLLRSWFNAPEETDALDELEQIADFAQAGKYGSKRIRIDPSVVRGLEYYTGPVYEVELPFEVKDEKGRPVRFGSVGGGGRYDGLVSRFMGQPVPATGFSIGVSRLQAALATLGKLGEKRDAGPVLVTVFGAESVQAGQKLTGELRNAGIRAELYLGNPKHGIGQQLKYADRRGAPCAVIQGPDEKAKGEVQLRDLIAGSAPSDIKDRDEYLKKQAQAQFAVKETELVDKVRELLKRHGL
jgi:histidyl-tRNA synthetase